MNNLKTLYKGSTELLICSIKLSICYKRYDKAVKKFNKCKDKNFLNGMNIYKSKMDTIDEHINSIIKYGDQIEEMLYSVIAS